MSPSPIRAKLLNFVTNCSYGINQVLIFFDRRGSRYTELFWVEKFSNIIKFDILSIKIFTWSQNYSVRPRLIVFIFFEASIIFTFRDSLRIILGPAKFKLLSSCNFFLRFVVNLSLFDVWHNFKYFWQIIRNCKIEYADKMNFTFPMYVGYVRVYS